MMQNPNLNNQRAKSSGFTLVELLVVIAIIATLGALGLSMLKGARQDGEEASVKGFIKTVEMSLELYRNDRRFGDYPPTSLEKRAGLGRMTNRTNIGIESLCVSLNAPGYKQKKLFEDFQDFDNLDEDASAKLLTVYGRKDLFEAIDPWGNPYAYFHARDYADAKLRQYTVMSTENEDHEIVTVEPWKDPKTNSYYKLQSFQFFSAGPDGIFNTEDDLGNWTQ